VGVSRTGPHKRPKQRVRIPHRGSVLRVELHAQEPALVGQLHDLDQVRIGVHAAEAHALLQQLVAEDVVHLVAVAVALLHPIGPVDFVGARAVLDAAVVLPEAHRPPLVGDLLLLLHEVDDGVGGVLVELGGVGPVPPAHVPRKLDDGALQPQADAEEGHVVLPGVLGRQNLALHAPVPEAGRHKHPRHVSELGFYGVRRQVLRGHVLHLHLDLVGHPGEDEALGDGLVGVLVLYVLSHQGDGNRFFRVLQALQKPNPVAEVGRVAAFLVFVAPLGVEAVDDELARAFVAEQERHLVDRLRVEHLDDGLLLDVAKEGDLAPHLRGDGPLRPADDGVRLKAVGEELLHGVLRGLRLQLARGAQVRDERKVGDHRVARAQLVAQLADGLQVGLALDVAHRPSDLGDDDVVVARLPKLQHPVLDLIDDVGHHLHGLAQVRPLPLLADHLHVDPPGGDVVGLAGGLVEEPLVVPEVEVRLGPVVGDVHLPVLVRVHRPRVDVDVRVELLNRHVEPAVGEQPPQGGTEDALAERGRDATGDEDVLGLHGTKEDWREERRRDPRSVRSVLKIGGPVGLYQFDPSASAPRRAIMTQFSSAGPGGPAVDARNHTRRRAGWLDPTPRGRGAHAPSDT